MSVAGVAGVGRRIGVAVQAVQPARVGLGAVGLGAVGLGAVAALGGRVRAVGRERVRGGEVIAARTALLERDRVGDGLAGSAVLRRRRIRQSIPF